MFFNVFFKVNIQFYIFKILYVIIFIFISIRGYELYYIIYEFVQNGNNMSISGIFQGLFVLSIEVSLYIFFYEILF